MRASQRIKCGLICPHFLPHSSLPLHAVDPFSPLLSFSLYLYLLFAIFVLLGWEYICVFILKFCFGEGNVFLFFFYCKIYIMFASGKAIAWMTFKATKEMRRNKDCAGPIERRVLVSTSVPRLIGFVQKMHQSISVHHLKYKIHSHKYKMHSHKYKIHCHKYKIRHTVS